MTTKHQRLLKEMTKKDRAAYFSGGRPTVGTITQVFDGSLIASYVGKLRGVIVQHPRTGEYKFKTAEEARSAAETFRAYAAEAAANGHQ